MILLVNRSSSGLGWATLKPYALRPRPEDALGANLSPTKFQGTEYMTPSVPREFGSSVVTAHGKIKQYRNGKK